jgi:hypothetical protein
MLYERSEVIEFTLLLSTIDIVIKKTPCHKQCLSVGKNRQRERYSPPFIKTIANTMPTTVQAMRIKVTPSNANNAVDEMPPILLRKQINIKSREELVCFNLLA